MKQNELTKIDNDRGCENSTETKALNSLAQPWFDGEGKLLPIHELRLISKNWDEEIWQLYLEYLEPVRKEKLVSAGRLQKESARNNESIFCRANSGSSIDRSRLAPLIRNLTERQREVIEMIYWQDMSQRQIAQALGLSQATVRDIKKDSLKKMRESVKADPLTLPISIGPKKNEELKEDQHADKNCA